MCIDICPVGALTSGTYRYQTRPVGDAARRHHLHALRRTAARPRSACATTADHPRQQPRPLRHQRRVPVHQGPLRVRLRAPRRAAAVAAGARERQASSRSPGRRRWTIVAGRFSEVEGSAAASSASSVRTTPPTKRITTCRSSRAQALGTNNIDHHRTGDVVTLCCDALSGRPTALATADDLYTTKAVLVVGSDLAQQHPLLAYQIRANWRHHQARIYTVTARPGARRQDRGAQSCPVRAGRRDWRGVENRCATSWRSEAGTGDPVRRRDSRARLWRELVAFGDSLGIPVKYVCLVDYSNSRGAVDMGLLPTGPGYQRSESGMRLPEMLAADDLDALWVVGANPLANARRKPCCSRRNPGWPSCTSCRICSSPRRRERADVVLPAASRLREVRHGDQRLRRSAAAAKRVRDAWARSRISRSSGLIAREMGLDLARLGPWTPDAVFAEIRADSARLQCSARRCSRPAARRRPCR